MKLELLAMAKIQRHQGDELTAMTSETEYPEKIKSLLEDLRMLRD